MIAQEVVRLQRGAADQGAADLGRVQDLGGVRGLHRAAVEDRRGSRRRAEQLAQRGADGAVHLLDLRGGGREARCRSPRPARRRPRRPCRPARPAASPSPARSTTASAWPALRCSRVSPTQTIGSRPAAQGGAATLARHELVGLAIAGAALGMAEDHQPRAGVGQHLGGDVAGEGAGVLRSGSPGRRPAPAVPASASLIRWIRVAGGQIATRAAALRRRPRRRPGPRPARRQAVHLPVSGDQGRRRGHSRPRLQSVAVAAAVKPSRRCMSRACGARDGLHYTGPHACGPAGALKGN